MLGQDASMRDASGICIFSAAKNALTVALTPNAAGPFQIMKLTASQNSVTVKDEPGIGAPAFSTVPKTGFGYSLFLLKGSWGAAIGFDSGPAKVPEPVRARIREFAKKIASRL